MSVKVAVRVRPFNERENTMQAAGAANQDQTIHSKCIVEMNGPMTTIIDPVTGQARPFTFDYSFYSHDGFIADKDGISVPDGPSSIYADQNYVYQTLGEQVLDNAWEGYHCCLFAYGQTGSGKSYSMIGHEKNKGIVPKACDEIFKRIAANQSPGVQYQVQISMLEIYNEKVQDLLSAGNGNLSSQGLKVRELKKGEVYVQGLSKHPVDSYDAIAQKMDEGQMSRSIGSTLMNQTSSRAHTIITIEFKQIQTEDGRKTEKLSVINLVDLAGSEKSKSTGAEGLRLKEGCAINKSLTVLGNCISVLAEKAAGKAKGAVVPYRDSNLTRILQNALGGNSKTIMICAISPSAVNYEESMSTLRYADRAKQIQNKAVVNESVQDKMIRELKSENDKLKSLLLQAAKDGSSTIDLGLLDLDDIDLKKLNSNSNLQGDTKDLVEQMMESQKQIQDMEIPWEQKLKEQRERDEEKKNQDIAKQAKNTRAPHLTNLNEDLQLSGKMYYSLEKCTDGQPFHIGRHDGDPSPVIVLRGVGIQKNHARITLTDMGIFVLSVDSNESYERTLVNGKRLKLEEDDQADQVSDGKVYKAALNHLDRIFIGVNTMFIFKYPLQRLKSDEMRSILQIANPLMEKSELEGLVLQRLIEQGVKTQEESLVCAEDQYTQQHIDEDSANILDFDNAYEEATLVEKLQKRKEIDEQLKDQQQALDAEKAELEEQYKKQIEDMKKQEQSKIQELMQQQNQFQEELQSKEESIKNIELQSKQQLEEQEQQAAREAANKVDKIEVEKLQAKLLKIQEEIQKSQLETQKQFKLKQDRMQQKITEKEEQIKKKSEKIIFELTSVAKEIMEANQICIMMGKNIKFKQCYIQMARETEIANPDRRSSSVDWYKDEIRQSLQLKDGKEDENVQGPDNKLDLEEYLSNQINEELQIRVQNFDKNSVVMWTIEQFQDRLEMLRDSLAQYEDRKQRKAERQAAKRLKREQKLQEAQSKKTNDDSNNSDSLSNASVNRNESVFEEINRGDDFEQDLIGSMAKQESSSEEADSSRDSEEQEEAERRKALQDKKKKDAQASQALVEKVSSNIDDTINAVKQQKIDIDFPQGSSQEAGDDQNKALNDKLKLLQESSSIQVPQQAHQIEVQNEQKNIKQETNQIDSSSQRNDAAQLSASAATSFPSQQTDAEESKQDASTGRSTFTQPPARDMLDDIEHLQRQSMHLPENTQATSMIENMQGSQGMADADDKRPTTIPNAPAYYIKDFFPQAQVKDQLALQQKKDFISKLVGVYTPGQEQVDMFTRPIPPELGHIQCTIERDKKGMNKFWPKYTLHLSDSQQTALLQSSKIKTSKTPHYRIEMKTGNEELLAKEDGRYLGRLRSNFQSSEFYLFDGGAKEDPKKAVKQSMSGQHRRQFATIIYTADQVKVKKPRRIQVYLPMIDHRSNQIPSWPDNELKKSNVSFEYAQQLIQRANEMMKDDAELGTDDPRPRQSDADKKDPLIMYFLSKAGDQADYHGRVSQPSKKNFQLTDEFDDSKVYLQFGRYGQESFNVDVSYPFSIYQAFAICLSTFDYKMRA